MMIEQHYDEEILAEFLAEPQDSVSRDTHLASCSLCLRTLDSLRSTARILREPSVWDKTHITTAPRPDTLAFLRNVQKTMLNEDAAAAIAIKQLLAGPREGWAAKLEMHPEWRTGGMVKRLIAASNEAINTVPADGLSLSEMAVAIAEGLGTHTQARHLQGMALQQYGYALMTKGALTESLAVLDSASERMRDLATVELDCVRVDVIRAYVYQGLERRDEALTISERSARVFATYGDIDRYAMARSTTAVTLSSAQRHRDAIVVNSEVVETVGVADRWRLSALHNMALAYSELGEFKSATDCLSQAIAGYEQIGMMTFRARSRWVLADVFARQGSHTQAMTTFSELREEFQELEMPHEVALLSLDIAESLMAMNRHMEIAAVCKSALDYFAAAGLSHTEPSLRGLAYLQEAAIAGRLTPPAVQGVRAFLLAPTAEAEQLFLELPQ